MIATALRTSCISLNENTRQSLHHPKKGARHGGFTERYLITALRRPIGESLNGLQTLHRWRRGTLDTRLHGWTIVCDEAGVKVEYLNCDNGTRVVFHRNDPFAESANHEELASSSQAVPEQFANDNENAAYAYLVANGPTGPAAIADVLGMTRRGAQKLLQRLVEQEYLEARGTTSNRVYYVSNKR